MNEVNEKDWELINAYHDGELSHEERLDLEARIAREPLLEQALNRVAGVSASLGRLRPTVDTVAPDITATPANDNNWRLAKWLAGGAVAASLALAAVLGPGLFYEPTAFDIHTEFTKQSHTIDTDDTRLVTIGGQVEAPDLSSASLTPVAIRTVEAGTVAHYAGRNGCRLSYFRGAFGSNDAARSGDKQVAAWSTGDGVGHMLVASGMDQDRFEAIVTFMKLSTLRESTDTVVAKVSDATAAAAPCLG
ncbi:MAG: hypothetical protein AAFW47_03850 [Pseudomonadota bacterium]